jgi:uncharacterized protein involved in exopolysaccharide biosynthesis
MTRQQAATTRRSSDRRAAMLFVALFAGLTFILCAVGFVLFCIHFD